MLPHPERLQSLALLEPAWAGNWDWSSAYAEHRKHYEKLKALPPKQLMPAFVRLGVRPDVVLPPPEPGSPAAVDGAAARGDPGIPADIR